MVFHMKTTLVIPDPIFRNLKRKAAGRGETLSQLVTACLRLGLGKPRKPGPARRLPSFSAGPPKVDIADRDALYRVLDADRNARRHGNRERVKGVRR
jgi:hypothetical protein